MSNELKNIPETVVVNKDCLSTLIRNYKEAVKKEQAWSAPLGIFISALLCVAATSEYQAVFFLSKENVSVLVLVILVGSFGFFVKALLSIFFSSRGKADSDFYSSLEANLKNKPDYTVIYIIKLTKDEIPRVLVEKKPSWACYFLPYVSRRGQGDISSQNITEFQATIALYLGVSSNVVSIEHFREFPLKSEKYSPNDKVAKEFNFDFFFFTIPKEHMLEGYSKSPFKIGGKEFYWMTLDELMDDKMTMERNKDVIEHLERNFTEFFAKTKDSFC